MTRMMTRMITRMMTTIMTRMTHHHQSWKFTLQYQYCTVGFRVEILIMLN